MALLKTVFAIFELLLRFVTFFDTGVQIWNAIEINKTSGLKIKKYLSCYFPSFSEHFSYKKPICCRGDISKSSDYEKYLNYSGPADENTTSPTIYEEEKFVEFIIDNETCTAVYGSAKS